jgi:undecaprenyl-diphosphatase
MPYRAFLPYSVLGTGLWAGTFCVLGYFGARSLEEIADKAGTGIFVFGATVAVIVGIVVAARVLREQRNRERVVAWMDARAPLRPLVALGRRVKPQARFLWNRITPGGLGLELTALFAVLAVSVFVLVGFGSIVSDDPGPTPGDTAAQDVVAELQAPWLTDVAEAVTWLGSTPAILLVALAAAVALAARRSWSELGVLLVALAIIYTAVPALKEAVDRPRPPDGLVDAGGYAYPSGHAAHSVIYAWLALTVAVRLRPGWAGGTALIAAGIAVTAAVGLSRVYLDVHWLSDVSGGWALGASAFALCAIVALVVTHLRQNPPREERPQSERGA